MNGLQVLLKDLNNEVLDSAVEKIGKILRQEAEKQNIRKTTRQISNNVEQVIAHNLQCTTEWTSQMQDMDLVIEAAIEDLTVKKQLIAQLLQACNAQCIIATNTSTINLMDLLPEQPSLAVSSSSSSSGRIIGLHFFSPAHVMPLLEIVKTPFTTHQILQSCMAFAKQVQKVPVVVGTCTGFLVNRVFFYYRLVTLFLVDCGIDPYRIDQAFVEFGFPMGPFRTRDLSGLDIGLAVMKSMESVPSYRDRIYHSKQTELMVQANRLGEKVGLGYYKYMNKAVPDPQLYTVLEKCRFKQSSESNMLLHKEQLAKIRLELSDKEIVEMALLASVNEACRVVDEGLVYRVSDIDVASILGMAFPRFHGGLMKWADLNNGGSAQKIIDKLSHYKQLTQLKLFEPAQYLVTATNGNKGLY